MTHPSERADATDSDDDVSFNNQNNNNSNGGLGLLFTAERFEPSVLAVTTRQQRKVVAWRMKERVRNTDTLFL